MWYLNDYLFFCNPSSQQYAEALSLPLQLYNCLGVPLSAHQLEISLLNDKLSRLKTLVQSWRLHEERAVVDSSRKLSRQVVSVDDSPVNNTASPYSPSVVISLIWKVGIAGRSWHAFRISSHICVVMVRTKRSGLRFRKKW